MPRSRSWAMASGEREAEATGQDEVRLGADDRLDVDGVEGRDVGQAGRLGRGVARRRRSRRRGHRRRGRTGSRSWPGSATRCARARRGWSTAVPSSSVRSTGKAAGAARSVRRSARPRPAAARRGGGRAAGGDEPGDEDGAARRGVVAGRCSRAGISGWWAGGGAGNGAPLASGDGSTEGRQGMRCTVLPTFLSKVRASTARSATGLPPRTGGHRSGTVPDSHRLRDHAALIGAGA